MKYENKVWVFDDAINLAYQNKIKEGLLGPDFSWFVKEGVSYFSQMRSTEASKVSMILVLWELN